MELPAHILQKFDSVELLSTTGGMGIVYKCIKNGKVSVLKVIRDEPTDPERSLRFKREIRILRSLNSPYVVKILEFNDLVEPYWYEMEYAPHGDLKMLVPQLNGDIERVKGIFLQICQALHYLHSCERQVVHRDIKSSNILIFDDEDSIKITDAGLARFISRDSTTLTRPGQGGGTDLYMSPEQYSGLREADIRSDIYSLGIVLLEMLTGTPHASGIDLDLEVPAPFNRIVRKMIQRNPDQRYQTIQELLEDYSRRMTVFENAYPFVHPELEFSRLLNELTNDSGLDGEKLGTIERILIEAGRDNEFVLDKLEEFPDNLLHKIAEQQPSAMRSLIGLYVNAMTNIMKEGRFPFSQLNTWTNYLMKAYWLVEDSESKRLCLGYIAEMAWDYNQFYSQDKFVDMLSGFVDEVDINIAIDILLENSDYRQKAAQRLDDVRIATRLSVALHL